MKSEQLDKSKLVGISQLTKDRFDIGSKSVAILGGILSIIALVVTLHLNNQQRAIDTDQRAKELRWNQAKLAKDLVDAVMSDKKAFNALRMTDWSKFDYSVDGGPKGEIKFGDVMYALDPKHDEQLLTNHVYIRECFDRLFYHMGEIKRSVRNGLVKFEDIKSPLDYYIDQMRKNEEPYKMYSEYMKHLKHQDALILYDCYPTACIEIGNETKK